MADSNSQDTNSPKPPSWATDNQSPTPNSDPSPIPTTDLTSSNQTSNQNPTITQSVNLDSQNSSDLIAPNLDSVPTTSSQSIDPVVNSESNLTNTNYEPDAQDLQPATGFTPPTDIPDNPMASLNTAGRGESDEGITALNTQFNQMDQQSNPPPQQPVTNPVQSVDSSTSTSDSNTPTPSSDNSNPPPPSFANNNIKPINDKKSAGDQVSFNKSGSASKILPIIIILILIAAIAFIVVRFLLPLLSPKDPDTNNPTVTKKPEQVKQITLTYWGLWEPNSVMEEVFDDFESQNPGVTIRYETQDKTDYRTRLQSAIDTNVGPDIYRIHNTWIPMFRNYIQPDTERIIDLGEYYPVVEKDLAIGGVPFAVPLGFDTLALYYNPELFENAGQTPPKTWDELVEVAQAITTKDDQGNIQIAGIALGDANSIANFSDILGLMIYQQGGDPSQPASEETKIAVEAYTTFATNSKFKFWSENLGNSIYAFAQGKVGMIFAPSWRAFEIEGINPSLEFKTVAVPQLSSTKVSWATYWAETVSKESENSDLAWKLLAFMSEEENLEKLYKAQSQLRGFGELYPKPSMTSSFNGEEIVSAFIEQGPYAKSWYLSSRTFDDGVNDKIIKYYENAINAIIDGDDTDKVLDTAQSGVSEILSRYGVQTTTTSSN